MRLSLAAALTAVLAPAAVLSAPAASTTSLVGCYIQLVYTGKECARAAAPPARD